MPRAGIQRKPQKRPTGKTPTMTRAVHNTPHGQQLTVDSRARASTSMGVRVKSPMETLPPELLARILTFLPKETLIKARLVAKAWLAGCRDILNNTAYCCRQQVETQTTKALWRALLDADEDDPSFVLDRYLARVIDTPRHEHNAGAGFIARVQPGFFAHVASQYQGNTPADFFHPKTTALRDFIPRSLLLCFKRPEERRQITIEATKHIQFLLQKWPKQLLPGTLFETAQSLARRAQAVVQHHPKALTWLLSPQKTGLIPEEPDAEGYRKMLAFLEESARFEAVLLEFVVFLLRIENRRPNPVDTEQNYFIFRTDFPLPRQVSATFYRHYLGYLLWTSSRGRARIALFSNPVLLEHVPLEDAQLLELLDSLWSKLPTILRSNPALYNRMRPELWIALAKNSNNHADVILADPKIYKTFTSEQLLKFLKRHRSTPDDLLKKNSSVLPAVLKHLELTDLCNLRAKYSLENDIPFAALIHRTLCEKLRDLSTNPDAFAEISGAVLETVRSYFYEEKYASEKGSDLSQKIISTELNRRTTERAAIARREQERQAAEAQRRKAEQARQLAAAQRQQQAQREQQKAALKRQQQEQQKLQRQRAFREQAKEEKRKHEVLSKVKQAGKRAEKLQRQKERETKRKPEEQSTTPRSKPVIAPPAQRKEQAVAQLSLPQQKKGHWERFKARWKALPLKWKVIASVLFVLSIIAIIVAAAVCPPSLMVTIPVVGKTVAAGVFIKTTAGGLGAITLAGHGIHTACQNPEPRAESFESENIAGSKKQTATSFEFDAAASTKKATSASARKKKTATSFRYVPPEKLTASESGLSKSAPSRMQTKITLSVARHPNALCNEHMRKRSTKRKLASADDAAKTSGKPATATSFPY